MIDREKVIKGLQCIIEGTVRCESCGYSIDKHGHHSCQQNCASDAITLLKKQEVVVRCKDCKYDASNCYPQEELPYWYPCKNGMRDQDWFCGYGKRR